MYGGNHDLKCKKCGTESNYDYCEICDIEKRINGLESRIDYDLLVIIKWLFSQFKEKEE